MKKTTYSFLVWSLMVVLTALEVGLKVLVKLCTIAVGLGINILVVCMLIAICTKQWTSLGVLAIIAAIGLVLIYGQATVLYLITEARVYLKR